MAIRIASGRKTSMSKLQYRQMAISDDTEEVFIGTPSKYMKLLDEKDKTELTEDLTHKARLKTEKISQLDISDDLLEKMVGDKPVNMIPLNDSVTLDKTVFPVGSMVDSLKSVTITKANNGVLNVSLTAIGTGYNITFWYYGVNGKVLKTVTIASLTQNYTLANWESLIWNFETNAIEIVTDKVLHTEKSVLLLKNVNGEIGKGHLTDRYHFFRSMLGGKYVLDQITDITFETPTTNSITRVKLYGTTNDILLYLYDADGKTRQNVKINTAAKYGEYDIPSWGVLVWDLISNTIKVVADSVAREDNSIILASGVYGRYGNGYLTQRFSQLRGNLIPAMMKTVAILDTPHTLYVANQGTFRYDTGRRVYFKFDGKLLIRRENGLGDDYTYQGVIDNLIANGYGWAVAESHEWVKNCIYLLENRRLTYNVLSKKFEILDYMEKDLYNIVIAENRGGILYKGQIADIDNKQKMIDAKVSMNTIPLKYLSEVQKKENQVLSLQSENTVTFSFSTDHHISETRWNVPDRATTVLDQVDRALNFDFLVNGGDFIIAGVNDKAVGLEMLKHIPRKTTNKDKWFSIPGNHDFNGSSGSNNPDGKQRKSWTITPYEVYQLIGKHQDQNVVWGNKEYMYYYKDFEDKKIRTIFLNTNDVPFIWKNDGDGKEDYLQYDPLVVSGIRQPQVEWLVNEALDFSGKTDKSEWSVIVISHHPLNTPANYSSQLPNRTIIREILSAFKTGVNYQANYTDNTYNGLLNLNVPCNFSIQGGMNVIGVFAGHNHTDSYANANGINYITTACGYPDTGYSTYNPGYNSTPNTYTEFTFDIVTIDKTARKVFLTRFGGGADREFTY